MRSVLVQCLCVLSTAALSAGYLHVGGRKPEALEFFGDAGDPLILTPLIQANKIQEAQNAARVNLTGAEGIESYSGYLTVNKQYNSNLFFWFFKSMGNAATDPVVLWLQGGPGGSSLIALFGENGPFTVTTSIKLAPRNYSWTDNHSVLYIDNPVGTGFSFTENEKGFATNETQIGKELYTALVQFFKLFPELQKNEFFITGESYAGKYIPSIAHVITKKNPTAALKINLKGIVIGEGLSDPITQLTQYGSFFYALGFIDINVRKQYEQLEKDLVTYIKAKNWESALNVSNELMMGENSLFYRTTKFRNPYSSLSPEDPTFGIVIYYMQYVNQEYVRRALHVGNTTYDVSTAAGLLQLDIPKSVKPWVSEMISNYRVLLYTGQLDILVPYVGVSNYLQNLEFPSSAAFKTATRSPYYVGTELAGYSKTAGNLTDLMIRNAGHLSLVDQPAWTFDMILRFTRNKSFS